MPYFYNVEKKIGANYKFFSLHIFIYFKLYTEKKTQINLRLYAC